MFRGVPRRLRFLSGALFGSMMLLLVAQTTEDHQRALLEDLIYTGSNGECWVRNDAVTGNGNWDTCGGLPGADEVTESMLKAVNGATDEYCLTYEATVGDFEWQTCSSGSVTGTGTDTHVVYWTGTSSLGGEAAFTYDDATNAAAIDGTLVLNDSASSIDALRVEGSSEPNLLVTDGSLNGVGIGTTSATDRLTVQGSSSGGVTTQTYNTNAAGYASFLLFSTSTPYGEIILGGPSNADTRFGVAGADQLQFIGAGAGLSAMVIGNVVNAPVVFGSNDLERLRIKGTGEAVFNDIAADFDVRMESQTQSSCFLLDASTSIISTGCDVSFPTDSIETGEIEDGTIREVDLMAVDAANDEECLTYETTTGDFEWQACSSGGGDSITVNSSAATDPDFLNGDIDWTLTGGNSITATVACSGCVDATDLAADSITPADLNTVAAAGAPEDEYCLTYEHGTTEFEWQACGGGPASGSGTTTIDFGAFPGSADATVAVTGLTGIGSSSVVTVALRPAATADHTADEHMVIEMRCLAKDITAGVGFTVHCFYEPPPAHDAPQNGWAPARAGLGRGGGAFGRIDAQERPTADEEGNTNRIHGTWTVGYIWM